ncbi:pilus assembly protein TadB [Amylibacter sp. SFDW26]|uniref:type II secretion system F family protein n=1 Tax=Amylibacter sp. SFDW26 TaxID=2652722 RepID=UPI001261658C|nr:type II secretion system F family protein [Amylibacter sp. SFDW26]KAB7613470.1 pilus assembly protein TadB [Amylibacter sp. SFDW26]
MSVAAVLLILFVGVIMVIEGLYLTVFGKSIKLNSRVNRRLALLEQGKDHEEVLNTLRKEREQHNRSKRVPVFSILATKAAQANIAFSPKALVSIMVALSIAGFVVLNIFTEIPILATLAIAIAIGCGGVYVWLNKKAKSRLALFEEQLPDAIELIVRSLRVGHPFSSAINTVAQEMPDPIGTEFGVIADEATYGRDLTVALEELAGRIDLQDLRFLCVAVGIQAQSGGNLAEVLGGLGQVIRSRFRLFRRVKAITSEAKFSGYFLSAFPLLALAAILMIRPNYYDEVQQTPAFLPAAIIVGAMMALNVFIMKSMVNIKV